jgi:large subunit ribosomal protein L18
MNLFKKKQLSQKRKWRIRKKVNGSDSRPRITVCFTNKNIHAQCVDDISGHTQYSVSTNDKDHSNLLPNVEGATKLGSDFASKLKKGGVSTIVFDRSGRKYHGCVKAFADSLRQEGIKF